MKFLSFFFSQQEESQRILAINSDLLSSQTRSCKDEPFLNISPFQKRLEALGQSKERLIFVYLHLVAVLCQRDKYFYCRMTFGCVAK